jgi:hypothetical protein
VNGTASPDALKLIRVALTAGVLLLGVAAFFIRSEPDREPVTPELETTLRLVYSAIAMGALIGVAVLRNLHSRAADPQRRAALVIAGWASGEAPALFGGVTYLLTGDPLLYVVGVAILFVAFILIPLPEQT